MEELIKRFERIDRLIKIKGTGRPDQLATKIGVCKRSIHNYLNFMKEHGAPIKFNFERQTYYYEGDGEFNISVEWRQKNI